MADANDIILTMEEARRIAVSCMEAAGADHGHAEIVADLLVNADYRGHYSHGLNRLDSYPTELRKGTCCGGGKEPTVIKESVATALVDGNNLLGPVVGKFCNDLAIKKAKEAGIGIVTVGGSNHYGIAGWYTMRAAEQGLLGFSYTNTSPGVVPTRGKNICYGTNPISFAAPGKDGDTVVLDMATSTVAYGKLDVKVRKGEEIPHSWAIDKEGKEALDPNKVMGLLPLGGVEESGGYKGFGLGLMVEVLTSVLSGSAMGPYVRRRKDFNAVADLSHCFIVIDPNAFADGFEDRISVLTNYFKHLEPADSDSPVLMPGDPEKTHMSLCDKIGGIPYHPKQMQFLNEKTAELKVTPPQSLQRTKE